MPYIPTVAILNQNILPQLEKLKQTGKDRWSACCPAHEDKSPSFQVVLTSDDRILMHCFSGCSINEICDSLDIGVTELFPDEKQTRYPKLGERSQAVTPTIDTHFIAQFKNMVKKGYKPTPKERETYLKAISRRAG